MDASALLVDRMAKLDVPFFFGPVPEEPLSVYPIPHAPGQQILDDAIKVIEDIQGSDEPEEVRHEAISLLLLQLYLHGYSAGAKHTRLQSAA
jgi:hypothetical protein